MNRQHIAMTVIKSARGLAANTAIQKLPITTYLYKRVFRFGYRDPVVTTTFRRLSFSLPTTDVTIVPGLIGGFYEKLELDIFERLCTESRSIVDVGGNIGLYACIAAKQAPPATRIVTFEPAPENIHYLRRNLATNGYGSRVEVVEKAVGNATGTLKLFKAKDNIGTHSASHRNAGSSTSFDIEMTSLDEFLGDELPDLIKIDVEGYDGFVLDGASRVISRCRPTLFVEFVPSHLQNCGYAPGRFIDLVFENYEHVFMVDEPRSRLDRCVRFDLEQLGDSQVNVNLVAVGREDHLRIVEDLESSRDSSS